MWVFFPYFLLLLTIKVFPGSGRAPGEGNGNPLEYSCLENPMDRGAWQGIACGVAKSQLCVPKVPNTWAGDEQRLGVGFGQLGLVAEHSVRCGESESYLPKLQRREQEEQRGQSASRAGWLEGSGVKAGDTAASPATRSGPGIVWASAHGNSFNGYHRTVSWSGKLINTGWSLRCQSQCWRSQ